MKFHALRLKRVWIPAVAVISLSIAGLVWASWGPTYSDPSELPYSEVLPSAASMHPAPKYGTKIRFEPSAEAAFARAAREDKLVLVLHLSGRFESSEMT